MRRTFSKELKRDAVSLVIEQGYRCVDAATSLGVHDKTLSRWVKEYKDDGEVAFRGRGRL